MQPLPGEAAHSRMANSNRSSLLASAPPLQTARLSAVMILLYPENQIIGLPLIKRAQRGDKHSGQMALPGGRLEPGETPIAAAIREVHEEIGVKVKESDVIGCLSELYIPPSHSLVTPVVAAIGYRPCYTPQQQEVELIVETTLPHLLNPEATGKEKIAVGPHTYITAPCYYVQEYVVWGATAMIISELLEIIKEI